MFIPGFEEQLVGANVGDQVDVNVTFPEVYHSAELAGKEAVFHCTVHEINEKRECQLDDEFARMFVGIESLEQMKQQLKAQMEEYAQLMAQNQVRDDLLKVLVEQIEEFDAEEALVENEIRIALDGFKQQLQQQGMEFANWLKLTGRTEEQVHADLRPQAIATLKARMALEEICRLENITVTEAEIDATYEEVSKRYGMTAKQLRDTFGADNDDKVRKDICMKKAIAFLESCADITEA
jgi:trigger factor